MKICLHKCLLALSLIIPSCSSLKADPYSLDIKSGYNIKSEATDISVTMYLTDRNLDAVVGALIVGCNTLSQQMKVILLLDEAHELASSRKDIERIYFTANRETWNAATKLSTEKFITMSAVGVTRSEGNEADIQGFNDYYHISYIMDVVAENREFQIHASGGTRPSGSTNPYPLRSSLDLTRAGSEADISRDMSITRILVNTCKSAFRMR